MGKPFQCFIEFLPHEIQPVYRRYKPDSLKIYSRSAEYIWLPWWLYILSMVAIYTQATCAYIATTLTIYVKYPAYH